MHGETVKFSVYLI